VLCKWFTEIHSDGKDVSGATVIEKAKSFYNEIKITHKCTFSEGSNKKLPVKAWVSIGRPIIWST
jgi:hypothetical protein